MKKWTDTYLRLSPANLAIFAIYATMLAVVTGFHEPWADEAQAWLLSRDLSIPALLFRQLRYEGHPGLWYLILWLPTHLHLPYFFFNWISATIALAGVYLFLRLAPFPLYVRALAPFSFFLAYEYAVIARSYVLFPLLAFLAAHFYRSEKSRPIAMAVVLALLTNLSAHGAIIAACLGFLYFRRLSPSSEYAARQRKIALTILIASFIFMLACLWPAKNSVPRPTPTWAAIISRLALPVGSAQHAVRDQPAAPRSAPPPAPSTPAAAGHSRLANLLPFLTYSFSGSRILAVAFDSLLLYYFWRRRMLRIVLPFAALYLFLLLVYSAPWHLGLLWVTCLMLLWITWNTSPTSSEARLQNAVAISLALLCALQLPWTAKALAFDLHNPTSPDKAAAAYVQHFPPGTRFAGFGMSNGIQPYFPHNIFFNQEQTFATWRNDIVPLSVAQVLAERPDVLIGGPEVTPMLSNTDFRPTRSFCGTLYFPNMEIAPGCLIVFERAH